MGDPPPEKHDHKDLEFPEGFLWGSATAAHQVEGNNTHSDWWEWESLGKLGTSSGEAADQYNRYEEDFELAKSLGHNAHRLSIEWARIEPIEGKFDEGEIEHYKKVLKSLKDKGFTVMLTLHHFTNPLWFSKKGGWENLKAPYFFERFVKRVVPEIKEYVDLWITINEPGIYLYHMYIDPQWPNAKKNNYLGYLLTLRNMVAAHSRGYKTIHKLVSHAMVGFAHNVASFQSFHKHSFIEQATVVLADAFSNHLHYFLTDGSNDFIGINYYQHFRIKLEKGLVPKVVDVSEYAKDVSDLGWEIHPEGIFDVLTDLADDLPIYISECGIASTNDDRRTRFLIQYLQEVYRSIKAGVKVKGFFYWSLLDNFEWHRGYDPRFGLVEVDYSSQKRTPRPSAYVYKSIVQHNGIPHFLLRLLGHSTNVEDVLSLKNHHCPECKNKQ